MNPVLMNLLGNAPSKIESGKTVIWEKKEPIYDSLLFNVPIKFIGLGILIYKMFKK
jgi:hypothetical protein